MKPERSESLDEFQTASDQVLQELPKNLLEPKTSHCTGSLVLIEPISLRHQL